MSEPTEEQIKEFWEWCGCVQAQGKLRRDFHYKSGQKVGDWRYPDGSSTQYGRLPRIDLNPLFNWAVPKLFWTVGPERWASIMKNWIDEICLMDMLYKLEAEALALFWAIYKVIKEG